MASVVDFAIIAVENRAERSSKGAGDGSQMAVRVGSELVRAHEFYDTVFPAKYAPPFAGVRNVKLSVAPVVREDKDLTRLRQTHGIITRGETHAVDTRNGGDPGFQRDFLHAFECAAGIARDVNHVRHAQIPIVIHPAS